MYVVLVYDVAIKKDPKMLKLLRRYLFHVQNSVFEGELTPKKYEEMCEKIRDLQIDSEEESIIVYQVLTHSMIRKEYIGRNASPNLNI